MAKKKKSTVDNDNQIELFDDKNIKEIDTQNRTSAKNISAGELLEYQIKRLFFFMGYFPKTNNLLKKERN